MGLDNILNTHLHDIILDATGASALKPPQMIQGLWSGYGSLDRYELIGAERESVIVKHVRLPDSSQHPRGWNTDLSHQRKLRSYQVETAWYQYFAERCSEQCRVPRGLALEANDDGFIMVMEDLKSSGYPALVETASWDEMVACLKWLAHFHATFMGQSPDHLWPVGTYWHLDTRPDELATMEESALKQAATEVDRLLTNAPFQTFVHGDAKLANFCFSADSQHVAAVDFQYVGGGCGMKDVAYFISSCLHEDDCERLEADLLSVYFSELEEALAIHHPDIDVAEVEACWRPLYAVAWTDFYRFLKGWSPEHWKIHRYSERLAQEVIDKLSVKAMPIPR